MGNSIQKIDLFKRIRTANQYSLSQLDTVQNLHRTQKPQKRIVKSQIAGVNSLAGVSLLAGKESIELV